MALLIKYSELNELGISIEGKTQLWDEQLSEVKKALEQFQKMDNFQGVAATNVKSYIEDVYGTIFTTLDRLSQEINRRYLFFNDSYYDIEDNLHASLCEETFEKNKNFFTDSHSAFDGVHLGIFTLFNEISDIVPKAKLPNPTDVRESYQNIGVNIEKLHSDVLDYENEHSVNDFVIFDSMIESLQAFIQNHIKRARSSYSVGIENYVPRFAIESDSYKSLLKAWEKLNHECDKCVIPQDKLREPDTVTIAPPNTTPGVPPRAESTPDTQLPTVTTAPPPAHKELDTVTIAPPSSIPESPPNLHLDDSVVWRTKDDACQIKDSKWLARLEYNKNFDVDKGKYIHRQKTSKTQHMKYKIENVDTSGCGPISIYNALIALEQPRKLSEIIFELQLNSSNLESLGTPITDSYKYFVHHGFSPEMIIVKDKITVDNAKEVFTSWAYNEDGEWVKGRVFLLVYVNNKTNSESTSHVVMLRSAGEGKYNVYNKDGKKESKKGKSLEKILGNKREFRSAMYIPHKGE